MKYRKLRIAWSVWWGVVALLLCAMWCRTYNWIDDFTRQTGTQQWTMLSSAGRANFKVELEIFTAMPGKWRHYATPVDSTVRRTSGVLFPTSGQFAGFYYERYFTIYSLGIPYWAPFSLSIVLAALPWLRHFHCRFSLRTLLICTTGGCAALAVSVYVNKLLEPRAAPAVLTVPQTSPPAILPTPMGDSAGRSINPPEVAAPFGQDPFRVDSTHEKSLFK